MLERLDKILVDQGYAASRTQAQKLIEAGVVEAKIQGQWLSLNKPAQKIPADTILRTGEIDELRFVSRAGLKLERALQHLNSTGIFSSDALRGAVILDIGQSTGGFTDCLLNFDVQKVVGIDVGHDQLAQKLRDHPSVVCLEGINGRQMPNEILLSYATQGFSGAVMDVSFISQTLILPQIPPLLSPNGFLLSLVKPQFEVGAKNLGKNGVVKNSDLYDDVRSTVVSCAEMAGLRQVAYFESAIEGGDGNREFFMLCQKPASPLYAE
jgi:23S rRNA (cytidine1920-2'-O)/16S rRNA (cytidine1409-2'-O)-methyltransferase